MKENLKLFIVVGLCLADSVCGASDNVRSWKTESLTAAEKACLEHAARMWIGKLWTNDYSRCQARFDARRYNYSPWTTHVDIEFRLNGKLCKCQFRDKNPDKLALVRNDLYAQTICHASEKTHEPVYTTEEQARARAAEYATLFGVSNLWDTSKFIPFNTVFNPSDDCWEYGLWPIRNGFLCPYGIHVSIADLPGAPLYMWHNVMSTIPPELPTNVVLTAEQARVKALEYMAKYFPYKEAALYKGQTLEKGDVPEMKCYTNRLEYVIPNYNYIRPAPGKGGLSDYVAKKFEIALAWVNYLGTPKNSKYNIGATIYVDAATGEMLGGTD